MASNPHSSAMAARQLVVPAISALTTDAFTLGHGPVVHTMSIPAASLADEDQPFMLGHGPVSILAPSPSVTLSVAEHTFTLGHGPVQHSKPTAATTLSVAGHPFTLQHGPVIVFTSVPSPNVHREYVRPAVPTAASTFATVARESPTTKIIRP